jgi:hypothetical protein
MVRSERRSVIAASDCEKQMLADRNKSREVGRATKEREVPLGGLLEWMISSINLEN